MEGRLKGKVAIVIGAGQTPGDVIGNGRAIALLFGREGAYVYCVDAVEARAAETAEMVWGQGADGCGVAADITKPDDVDRLVAKVMADHGRIDVLVNNVGILARGDDGVEGVDLSAYDRIMDINVRGMLLTIKAVVPIMRRQEAGSIVNISSAAAEWGGYHLAYEVSKAAVNRLTTSTAQSQARHGIRCNAVQLGLMDTPMVMSSLIEKGAGDESTIRAGRDARVPLGGKMGTGWDAAYPTLFFASDESRFITGAVLPVDGGTGVRAAI